MTEKTPKTSSQDPVSDQVKKTAPSSKPELTPAAASTSAPVHQSSTSSETPVTPQTGATTKEDNKAAGTAPRGAAGNAQPVASSTDAGAKRSSQTAAPASGAATTRPAPSAGTKSGGTSKNGASGNKPAPENSGGSGRMTVALLLIAVLILALAAGLWYQVDSSRQAFARLETQSQASIKHAQQAQSQARQALDTLAQQNQKLAQLADSLSESRSELSGLNDAFQLITDRGSDLVLLNDIDHLVTIAQQQLQLSGNVANAIISLETAQAQLARANRPALASLQQTINGDVQRLRAASTVDIALLSGRLDELAGLVAQAPLLVPDDASPAGAPSPASSAAHSNSSDTPASPNTGDRAWWQRTLDRSAQWLNKASSALRDDLGNFISVRRVDDPAALMISPDQATRFRDNLRLRIMTAQLALMMGQPTVWQSETASLLDAIEGRFDDKSPLTRRARRIARDVADTSIESDLPTVDNSIKAIEALRSQDAVPRTEPGRGSAAGASGPTNDVAPTEAGNDISSRGTGNDSPTSTEAADGTSPAGPDSEGMSQQPSPDEDATAGDPAEQGGNTKDSDTQPSPTQD